ncbi:hypothetical protein [Caldimonas brevitalea]|uniref:Uncharacterized protein n=1 Tax=Caldimonas brevitalea TaxID=413882 RepID=A0A0G3BRE5_9BURK|nr:hypothetical protein [Caldimonas brevitalea]AKJ31992.1 hypothetical protein AAW51_5301 [Caldimonas brevitalea]
MATTTPPATWQALTQGEPPAAAQARQRLAQLADDIAMSQAAPNNPVGERREAPDARGQARVRQGQAALVEGALECKQATRNMTVAAGLLTRNELNRYQSLPGHDGRFKSEARDLVPANSPRITSATDFKNLPPGFAISFEAPTAAHQPPHSRHSMVSLGNGFAVGSNNGCIHPPAGSGGNYEKMDLSQPDLWLADGRFKGKRSEQDAADPYERFHVLVSPLDQFADRVKARLHEEDAGRANCMPCRIV